MKRVLVTGATGFVGRHTIAPLLARGYEVHTVSRHDAPVPGAIHHLCDLLDSTATTKLVEDVAPSHLLHCAWYATPGLYWTSTENLRWLEASLSLLRAFAARGGRRFAGVGSCAEYDWSFPVLSERDTPLRPNTLYGACKHALASVTEQWASTVGVSAAWGRLFFMFGPHEHEHRLVASVIRALLQGTEAEVSEGTQIRDFLYSADAGAALVALLDSEVVGPVNIASGKPIALRDLVLAIAAKLDARALVRFGARPTAANEPHRLEADTHRLREEVGWRDARDLSQALDETIIWWRA
jgi:nucleoside-diphosphate-sugar epimerase